MNFMEAVVALGVFFGGLSVILGSVSGQSAFAERASAQIIAEGKALECGAMIDSAYSNNITLILNAEECFGSEGKVFSEKSGERKWSGLVADINSENGLEVGLLGHYAERNGLFD